jgi:hypothetical protein
VKTRHIVGSEVSIAVAMKSKAILVTDRGGPQGCETPRFPHFLGTRLTDGGEVVSFTSRPPFNPSPSQEDSCYSFLLEAESTPGP